MLKFLITAYGQEIDYSSQVDWPAIKISESVNIPVQCTFSIRFSTSAYPVPPLRAYVRVYSTINDRTLFTGFISSPPVRKYMGLSSPSAVPKEALGQQLEYQYTASSDEHLLNIKSVPFIPAFVNRTQGEILSTLADILCPNFFDTSQVEDGDLVPFFTYSPSQSWSEIAKLFGDGSRYRYHCKDKKIWYTSYGDQPLGISYDETKAQSTFDARGLDTTILAVPTVNDITIIGDAEAGNNREDYFIGDGFTGNFPLRHKVFRGATSVLLQETWQNTALNKQQWFLEDDFENFDFSAGALNVLTGASGHPLGTGYLAYQNGIELAGGIDIQNGEFTFNDYSQGVVGGVYADDTFLPSGFLGGFVISTPGGVVTSASGAAGVNIQPTWNNVAVGPAVLTKANHTYVLQMVVTAPRYSRYDRVYRTIEGVEFGGVQRDVTGSVSFFIQDFDITAASGFFYTPQITQSTVRDVEMPAFAAYALINNQRLNLTVGNTTIATMPYGGLYADVGPLGLFQPTGAILPLLPESGGGGQYPGPVLPWGNPASGNYVLAPPSVRQGWQPQVLGSGLELEAAQITSGNDADQVSFYAQSIPIAGTPVRLQTWEQQAAVSRLQNQQSIQDEALLVGDDGIRSAIVPDLNPLPRTSEDCDNAALAYLSDRGSTQYDGTYQCTSFFFRGLSADLQFYPTTGRFFNVHSPARGIVRQKFLVTKLDIGILDAVQEIISYNIGFGVDLYLEKVLKHFVDIAPASVLTPQDKATPPNPRYTQNVDDSFLPDINDILPVQISDAACIITILNSQPYPIEVRTVDGNWGRPTVDLVGVFQPAQFTLNRLNFDQTWFMRYSQAGVFSRRSKVVRVRYPQKPSSPTFISATPVQAPGPNGTTVSSYQVQFDYNGDIRNIYGFELRAADNRTILYQVVATSYGNLRVDLANMTPMAFLADPLNTEFSFYAYFFNHQWSYSDPLVVDAAFLIGSRLPYLWSPNAPKATLLQGEAAATRQSFAVSPFYTLDRGGHGVAYVNVRGYPIANQSSPSVGEPVLAASPGTAGGPGNYVPPGTYIVAASARDGSSSTYRVSPLSDMITVTIPALTTDGSINVSVLSNPFGVDVYVALTDAGTGWYRKLTMAAGVLTSQITSVGTIPGTTAQAWQAVGFGAPDPLFDHYIAAPRKIVSSGVLGGGVGVYVNAVTPSTLTLYNPNPFTLATNDLAGRIISLLGHNNPSAEVELANFLIQFSAAAAESNTVLVTIGPNANGVNPPDLTTVFQVNDLVQVRMLPQSITATSFQDPLFVNPTNLDPPVGVIITSVGTVATVTWLDHGLNVGQTIIVAGADQAGYNGQQTVASVIDHDTFTYTLSTSQVSPATGNLTAQIIGGTIHAAQGLIAWIIYGTGSTQAQPWRTVIDNDVDTFFFDSPWDVNPDSTSVVIILALAWEPWQATQNIPIAHSDQFYGTLVPVQTGNFAGANIFVQVFAVDANGNYAYTSFMPFREIYLFGIGTLTTTLVVTPTNNTFVLEAAAQFVKVDTTVGPATIQLPPIAQWSGQIIRIAKISNDLNAVNWLAWPGDNYSGLTSGQFTATWYGYDYTAVG